jgi:hypothetical protein
MRIITAALSYFALAFGAGFLLGILRVALLVPRIGVRDAELIEMPVMGLAVFLAARFVTRRWRFTSAPWPRAAMGLIALGLLLGAELCLVVVIQDQTLGEYIRARDPVSGSVYLVMLAVYAAMPWLLARPALRSGARSG